MELRGRAHEGAGSEAEDSFEVTMQEALIVKADTHGDLGLRHSASEEALRQRDPAMRDVRVRWKAQLLSKRSAKAELVEACVRGERIETDCFGDGFV